MKYNDPAIQSKLLDLYCMHKTDTEVARQSGVSRVTLWRMNAISLEGVELQEVDWGGIIKPWHEHRLDALDLFIEDVQQRIVRDAASGYYVDEVQSGCYHHVECEYAHSLSQKQFEIELEYDDLDRELKDVPRVWPDKMKREYNPRTKTWERQRVQRFIPPVMDAQAKVLAAFAPELFGDKRSVTLQGSIGLGVTVIGTRPPIPDEYLVQAAPPVPPLISADVTDADYTDILGPAPQPEETAMTEPEQPAVPSSLTTEQQRILEQLRSPNPGIRKLAEQAQAVMARAPKDGTPAAPAPALRPGPSGYTGSDQDDAMPRKPSGMRVV